MSRRSGNGSSVSFFSFQDILIGTIGIVLMMTIILVLLIGSDFASRQTTNARSGELENQVRITRVQEEVDELQRSVGALAPSIDIDRTSRKLQLREAMLAAIDSLDDTQDELTEKRETLEGLADSSDVDERAIRALTLMKTRDILRETVSRTRVNARVTYQLADPDGLEPIILEISREGIIVMIDGTSASQSALKFRNRSAEKMAQQVLTLLSGLPKLDKRYLLFVIKPSGIPLFRYIESVIMNDGTLGQVERGYDLLPESHSIANRFLAGGGR